MNRRPGSFLPAALLAASLVACAGGAPPATPPPASTAEAVPLPAPAPSPPVTPDSLTPGEAAAEKHVTAASIDAPLKFLADDLLEGRGPGARGDDLAMKFIASEMEAIGLHPGVRGGGGDDRGSFFQKVPLIGITSHFPATETFTSTAKGGGKITLALSTDLVIEAGTQEKKARFDASDIVFVGYGIVAPEYQWNDYKDVDVKGKVVLVMNNDPETDPNLFAGKTRLWYGRWDYKYLEAAKHGAAGCILIHTTPSAAYPWQVVVSSNMREKFELPAAGEPRLIAKMWTTEDASRKLVKLAGKDLDALRAAAEKREFVPVPLGVRTSLTYTNDIRTIETANVVGILPGSDPKMASEAVVYSAHHDHLGIGAPAGTKAAKDGKQGTQASPVDTIYNGAIDNASGVATLLSIARAAAASEPTKRTRVFLAVAAEEQGLLGSEWYARHPTFPAGRIAADLNIDSANMYGTTKDVGFTGYGRSSLDGIVDDVAKAQGRTVHGDPFPEKGSAYRSDQFSFAKIGVPGVYVRGGPSYVGRAEGWGQQQEEEYEAHHYHQPSDEYSKDWDFGGAVEDARLLLVVGMRIANDASLPTWKPGNEFEAARKAAIAAVPAP
jgi:Zn-dependent M28 family amino/carboxypeptidase